MKTTESKIKQCEKLLGELKEELLKESKPEFKATDWVKHDNYNKVVYRITSIDNKGWCLGLNNDETNGHHTEDLHLATPEEIKEHLIKEAERRGYKEGVTIQSLGGGVTYNLVDEKHWAGYYPGDDEFFMMVRSNMGLCVYRQGEWAEIVDTKKTIKLNDEYEAEIFDDYVKVGCSKFSFAAIKKLYKAIK